MQSNTASDRQRDTLRPMRMLKKRSLAMLWAKTIVEAKTILEPITHFGSSQWIAVFAGVLILTSFVQGIWISRANRVASEAANAAKRTADFLQVTERAYVAEQVGDKGDLLAKLLGFGNETHAVSPGAQQPDIVLSVPVRFTNYGKTPAMLKHWAANLSIDGAIRKFDDEPSLLPIRILAPGEQTADHSPSVVGKFRPTAEQGEKLTDGSLQLWVSGYVEFEDIFGKNTKREFAWRYDRATTRFVPHYFQIIEEN
jgi:hypothetical protein